MKEVTRRKANRPEATAPQTTQRNASDPKASVWVAASAGSGKTTVLTSRVIRLLLDGVAPQRILCLTFTRAAAAEMSNRIIGKLGNWAVCPDAELFDQLDELDNEPVKPGRILRARRLFAEVLACPGGMRIRTIHAFCQEILGRFPIEAGLPPHFSVIEEASARDLIEETESAVLQEIVDTEDHPLKSILRNLIPDLGERGFARAMQSTRDEHARLIEAVEVAGGLEQLVARIRETLELDEHDSEEGLLKAAFTADAFQETALRRSAEKLLGDSDSFKKRGERLLHWLARHPDERLRHFDDWCRCFLTKEGTPLVKMAGKANLTANPELDDIFRAEAERLRRILAKLERMETLSRTENVLRFGLTLAAAYQKRKSERAALDFDDLILRTSELLQREGIAPWVLFKLDGGLGHILIDEAQDTSREQWRIVQALTDEFFSGGGIPEGQQRSIFVVGDEKQSIFSFQNADPDAFAEMHDYFARRLEDSGSALRPVNLQVSFRSAPAILNAVDEIFREPSAQAGVSSEPIHHDPAPLRLGDPEKVGRVELWPLRPAPIKEKAAEGPWALPLGYEDEEDPVADMAKEIASKIAAWLATEERIAGTDRPIAPGDIMILVRRRGRFADLMVRALKKVNVPVTGVDRMMLTHPLAVLDLLALCQFALLPDDDLNLANLLKSPLINLGDEELMTIAMHRKASLWQSLNEDRPDLRFQEAKAYLTHWLNEADFVTPFTLLTRVLNEPCPGGQSGRMALWSRLGTDALDPIDELLNASQSFGSGASLSLQAFVHRILSTETTIKRELDQGSGEVRIMTVHGSKGLEAPIVFLPDTTSVPRAQELPNLLWTEDDLPLYLPRQPKSGAALEAWRNARLKQLEEYRRLFYVALTRAARRLYIAGWELGRKQEGDEGAWYNLASAALQKRHEPASIGLADPVPLIAFEDQPLRPSPPLAELEPDAEAPSLPTWVGAPIEQEEGILASLAPSRIETTPTASPDAAFTRGRLIHRLLENLPNLPPPNREDAARHFLALPQFGLSHDRQREIAGEVLGLLKNPIYEPLWGPLSRAEVPLAGLIGGQPAAGQVDRLCIQGDEVWIVDYKTNRPPPSEAADAPDAYIRQMAAYRELVEKIYPGKRVRSFLLWTYTPILMELSAVAQKC